MLTAIPIDIAGLILTETGFLYRVCLRRRLPEIVSAVLSLLHPKQQRESYHSRSGKAKLRVAVFAFLKAYCGELKYGYYILEAQIAIARHCPLCLRDLMDFVEQKGNADQHAVGASGRRSGGRRQSARLSWMDLFESLRDTQCFLQTESKDSDCGASDVLCPAFLPLQLLSDLGEEEDDGGEEMASQADGAISPAMPAISPASRDDEEVKQMEAADKKSVQSQIVCGQFGTFSASTKGYSFDIQVFPLVSRVRGKTPSAPAALAAKQHQADRDGQDEEENNKEEEEEERMRQNRLRAYSKPFCPQPLPLPSYFFGKNGSESPSNEQTETDGSSGSGDLAETQGEGEEAEMTTVFAASSSAASVHDVTPPCPDDGSSASEIPQAHSGSEHPVSAGLPIASPRALQPPSLRVEKQVSPQVSSPLPPPAVVPVCTYRDERRQLDSFQGSYYQGRLVHDGLLSPFLAPSSLLGKNFQHAKWEPLQLTTFGVSTTADVDDYAAASTTSSSTDFVGDTGWTDMPPNDEASDD